MSRSNQPSPAPSGPDVSQLAAESLTTATFPTTRQVPFRVHFDPQTYLGMTAHAAEDVSFEICGVLVGLWERDDDGPFVTVRNFIRCDSAAKKFAEVTFTHKSWSHINHEMDTKYHDQRIVGWYHSHPNFGIFLSERDLFIQQNFFSGPGQIALVIDPVRKIEGVFEWHQGNAVPTPHYWVGNQIQIAPQGSDVTGMPEAPIEASQQAHQLASPSTNLASESIPYSSLLILAGLGLFLAGWILSGWRTQAERHAMIEGTVAHFGFWKGLRPDLDTELRTLQRELSEIASRIKPLATEHLQQVKKTSADTTDEKGGKQTGDDWRKLMLAFDDVQTRMRQIERLYMYTPEEREAVRKYLEKKLAELSKGIAPTENTAPPAPESTQKGATKKLPNAPENDTSKEQPTAKEPTRQK